jgi:hypothetical protein
MPTREPKARTKQSRNEQSVHLAISDLGRVVELLVESRIRIDAMEQILVKTNPVAYELYVGTIKNLQAQKTAEVTRVLTQTLKSKPTER